MIGSTYIRVHEGRRPLRLTALRQSQRPQVVRVGGAHYPNKMSRIWWFNKIELRPSHGQPEEASIAPQDTPSYWLAIQVFSNNAGQGWFQSTPQRTSALMVPEIAVVFDDYGADDASPQGVVLGVAYADAVPGQTR